MLHLLKKLNRTKYVILDGSRRRGLSMINDVQFLLRGEDKLLFFDVGANVGQTTLSLKGAFPCCSVHAFEPIDSTMSDLRRQTEGLVGVEYHQSAMGTAKGSATMEVREHSAINSLIPDLNDIVGSVKCGEAIVNIDTVDDFCAERGIDEIHLLKTDTEGFDLEVLKGASVMLGGKRVRMILSEAGVHSGDRRHTSLSSLMNYLGPLGYYLYSLYDLPLKGCERSGEFFNALFVAEVS